MTSLQVFEWLRWLELINKREHPFNLKGGGGLWFFWKKNFLSPIEKKIVSEIGRKKYSVSTLCFKKYCFSRKKLMLRQLVAKLFF